MHSGTGSIIASAIIKASKKTGMPNGVFSNLNSKSFDLSHELVKHPKIKAIGFTGSYSGASALNESVLKRQEKIPFFAEMGSVNPIAITESAIEKVDKKMVQMLAGSISLGAGQFCTQPGLLLVTDSKYTDRFVKDLDKTLKEVGAQCMIHPDLKKNYIYQSDKIKNLKGVIEIQANNNELDDNLAHPKLYMVSGNDFIANSQFQEEVFGPFSLIIKCKDLNEMEQVIKNLEGQLTGSIFAKEYEYKQITPLIQAFKSKVGRLLFNDVPTGVEVSEAMTHGGPYPASSDSRFSAVGPDSIYRWVRPITYQNWPKELIEKLIH